MIYRLPCSKAFSLRKSLRAVSTVGRNRYIENTPLGSPSGTALRLESTLYSVERLFPLLGGVSRGSVRVGVKTFLLPFYDFSFGYKRKGVNIKECKRYHWSGDTTLQSFCSKGAKIQLSLHRGAEARSQLPRCEAAEVTPACDGRPSSVFLLPTGGKRNPPSPRGRLAQGRRERAPLFFLFLINFKEHPQQRSKEFRAAPNNNFHR